VQFAYNSFVQIVADGRDMSLDEVDPLAQGRIWSSPDALEAGLVDGVGSLGDAIAAAAARAGMEDYKIDYVELPRSPRDVLMQQLADRVGSLGIWTQSTASATLSALLQPVAQAAGEIAGLQDPRHIYLRCVACAITP
jgi:protease-4